jgi:hypothetical protein
MSYMHYLQSLYRGVQIAKPNAVHSRPVCCLQQASTLVSSIASISQVHHASGHPCMHRITLTSHDRPAHFFSRLSAYIRLGRPPLHSVGQSVRLTASPLSSRSAHDRPLLRVSCSEGERAVTPRVQARRRVGGVVRRRERCCAFLGLFLHGSPYRPTATQRLVLAFLRWSEAPHLHLRLRLVVSRRAGCAMSSSSCSHASLVNSPHVIFLWNPAKVSPCYLLCSHTLNILTMLSTRLNSLPQPSHSHVIVGLCFASCLARSFLLEKPPSVACGQPSCRQNSVFECRL